MKTRRGASLVELLMIMSACTVVLTLTGVLLQRVMRIQMQSRAHVNVERSALRLSEQFRSDVHQARAAVTGNPEQDGVVFLRLESADNRVIAYSRDKGAVKRLESSSNQPTRREEFEFPAASVLQIEQQTAPQRLALTIILKPVDPAPTDNKPLASTSVIPVSLCAEAVVGSDLRFDSTPAASRAQQ